MSKKEERFVAAFKEGSDFTLEKMVLVDRETGVNYLFVKHGYGAGLTPLLDAEGKPVVTRL